MQKTFLKLLTFEYVERLARFESLLQEGVNTSESITPKLTDALRAELAQLKQGLVEQKPVLNQLFSDAPLINDKLIPSLEAGVFEPNRKLQELTRLLYQLYPAKAMAESYLFTKDALPVELIDQERSVILEAELSQPPSVGTPLEDVLLLQLPLLQKNNPLGWVGLVYPFALKIAQKALASESAEQQALAAHAFSLRLAGPAYYFQTVTQAMLTKDTAFFQQVESVLFYGLNHLNFVNKSLVIVHEAIEKAQSLLGGTPGGRALDEAQLSKLYQTVESTIPTRLAFTDRHFEQALQLKDRLSEGVLPSSSPVYTIVDVNEKLQAARQAGDVPIYDLLGMMTEHPHSPREIVNAGWIHKIERAPVWLYSTLFETEQPDPDKGQSRFQRTQELLGIQDHLLQKAIETSEIHRVLLCSL